MAAQDPDIKEVAFTSHTPLYPDITISHCQASHMASHIQIHTHDARHIHTDDASMQYRSMVCERYVICIKKSQNNRFKVDVIDNRTDDIKTIDAVLESKIASGLRIGCTDVESLGFYGEGHQKFYFMMQDRAYIKAKLDDARLIEADFVKGTLKDMNIILDLEDGKPQSISSLRAVGKSGNNYWLQIFLQNDTLICILNLDKIIFEKRYSLNGISSSLLQFDNGSIYCLSNHNHLLKLEFTSKLTVKNYGPLGFDKLVYFYHRLPTGSSIVLADHRYPQKPKHGANDTLYQLLLIGKRNKLKVVDQRSITMTELFLPKLIPTTPPLVIFFKCTGDIKQPIFDDMSQLDHNNELRLLLINKNKFHSISMANDRLIYSQPFAVDAVAVSNREGSVVVSCRRNNDIVCVIVNVKL